MSMLSSWNPIRAWNRFWFAPVGARPLGVFRVVFGVLVLWHLALLWPEANLWLSDSGYLIGTEARELAGPLRWSPLQHFQDPASVQFVIAATALAALGFAIGWHTRLCGVAQYAGLLSIHHRNILTLSGADTLLMITAFWLMLSPCGAACSLDRRRKSRGNAAAAEPLIVPWTQRVMQLQLSLVYFATAMSKSAGTAWTNGTALFHILNCAEIRRWTLGLTDHIELINAFTFSALFLEFALAFLLWFRPMRPYAALCGVALHAGIMLTVNIPVFGELMMATYLLFLTPGELNTFLRVVTPACWFSRRSAVPAVPKSRRKVTTVSVRSDPAQNPMSGSRGTLVAAAELIQNSRSGG